MAKKPSLAFILSGKGDDSEEDESPEPKEEDEGGKVDAASAVLDAITAGDAQGLKEALDAFLDLR